MKRNNKLSLNKKAAYSYCFQTPNFDVMPVTLFPSNIEVEELSIRNSFRRVSNAFFKTGDSIRKALKDAELMYGKR